MPRLRIDNLDVTVPEGATVLDAARALGIDIPTLCHLDGCTPQTSCLVCVVRINGASRLVPSCGTPALDGMVVESETDEVRDLRRTAIELLLGEHTGDCFAPCQAVCPAHMDIPTMMRQIRSGALRDAIATVKSAIPLPATLGRICPELCEKGCRRGRHDAAVSICSLKRYVADKDLAADAPYLPARAAPTGKRVAIVGTGPAGLTAAWFLLQRGHDVTLYDARGQPGGALRYAIDAERLPRAVLDGEIDLVRALGARFEMNRALGVDLSLGELRRSFDAVLLALGPLRREQADAIGIAFAGQGLQVDRRSMETSLPGVFAAGGALLPLRHAIRAVADGQAVALAIDDHLAARPTARRGEAFAARMGKLSDEELRRYFAGAVTTPRMAAPSPTATIDDGAARAEAERCAHCDCGKVGGCRLRQVAAQLAADPARYRGRRRAFVRDESHPLVTYEPGKCILCGLCVEIATRAAEPLGLAFVGRGFDVVVSAPFGAALSQGLRRVARACADACPTGALALRDDASGCAHGPAGDGPARLPLPVLEA